jgi:hypothetical protein
MINSGFQCLYRVEKYKNGWVLRAWVEKYPWDDIIKYIIGRKSKTSFRIWADNIISGSGRSYSLTRWKGV